MARFFMIPLLLVISGLLFLFSSAMLFSGIWGLIGFWTGLADVYSWGFGLAFGLPSAIVSWGSLRIAWVLSWDEKLVPKEKRLLFMAAYVIIFLVACVIPELGIYHVMGVYQ